MTDNFRHDEIEEFLGKGWIKSAFFGEGLQAFDLARFAGFIGRRHLVFGFQSPNSLRHLKPLGERVQQNGIEIIDARAKLRELIERGGHLIQSIPFCSKEIDQFS